jgi:tetratricopeptide (TPR) repeat protein
MRILIGAAAVGLSASVLWAQVAAPASSASPAVPPASSPLPTDPVPDLSAALTDPNLSQTQRDEAASQLVARAPHAPAAADALLRGLTGGHDQALAVAHAIEGAAEPDPQWIAPLSRLLGSPGQLNDAAAEALSRFSDDPTARDALIGFARDQQHVAQQRATAASALRSFVDKTAAEALVQLLENPHPSPLVNAAAAEALIDMTGQEDNDNDPVRWRNWFNARAALPDAQWKAQVYPGRDSRLQRVESRQKGLATEVDSLLTDEYHAGTAAQQNALIMRFLNSTQPDVRAIGAEIVGNAQLQGLPYPRDAGARITQLVGDSDPQVRLKSAQALQVLVVTPALNALLQQLTIETRTDVKIALLGAISQIDDPRSLSEVRKMLHDPSIDVAIAAAGTIKQLGKSVFAKDPALARDTAEELWQATKDRANEPRANDFKAAAIEAMAPLKDDRQSTEFPKLLNINEPESIRAAALHALRDLGNKDTSDAIASWLTSEPVPALRADAIDALSTTGTFETDAQALYDHTKPANEPDPAVRDKAWKVWDFLLGDCTNNVTLNNWAHQMSLDNDFQHRIDALNVLNANLLKQDKLQDLAYSEQNTGDAYTHLSRPDLAAPHFKNALDYWVGQNVQNAATATLVDQLTKALLQSKQYDKAVQFGDEAIARNKSDGQTIGVDIRDMADQLNRNPATRADATKLIDLSLHMSNLPQQYKDALTEMK